MGGNDAHNSAARLLWQHILKLRTAAVYLNSTVVNTTKKGKHYEIHRGHPRQNLRRAQSYRC